MIMEKKPFKIDKNGTEYYYNWTCPRCGGLGGSDAWTYTGWTCYDCGGSGKRSKPQIIKKYTKEYEEKLQARRKKAWEKKLQKMIEESFDKNHEFFQKFGFDQEGKTFVVLGDTYPIKDRLKELGCRFDGHIGWHCSHDLKDSGYDCLVLDVDECYRKDLSGTYNWSMWELSASDKIKSANDERLRSKFASDFFGQVGDRFERQVTVNAIIDFKRKSFNGYSNEIAYVYKFVDSEGNIFTWITTAVLRHPTELKEGTNYTRWIQKGDEFVIRGTIKKHSTYNNELQNEVQRVKIIG